MFSEKIVKQINHKLWKEDVKILNYNDFHVFNVELYKEKLPFIFDDSNGIKHCDNEEIVKLEGKLKLLFVEVSNFLSIPFDKIKIHSSRPIDPINPELFFTNCYFTPARIQRVFQDGYNKETYSNFKDQMTEEEFLDKYSHLERVSQPILRTDTDADNYILNSKLYSDFRETILSENDEVRIEKLNNFKNIMKDTAKKDLETIVIDNKFIEGYSFKYCNGLYVTCYIDVN